MADDRRPPRARVLRRLVVAAIVVACAGLWAVPASAHASLSSSNPADGATLSSPPAAVELTFDEPLLEDTETVSINDMDGNVVASQQVIPTGSSVSVPWPDALTSGTFQIAYRVVSADGHPVMGAITFSIVAAPSTPSGSTQPSAAASQAPASAVPVESASASTDVGDAASSGVPGLAVAAVAVVLVAAAVAVAFAVRRRH